MTESWFGTTTSVLTIGAALRAKSESYLITEDEINTPAKKILLALVEEAQKLTTSEHSVEYNFVNFLNLHKIEVQIRIRNQVFPLNKMFARIEQQCKLQELIFRVKELHEDGYYTVSNLEELISSESIKELTIQLIW